MNTWPPLILLLVVGCFAVQTTARCHKWTCPVYRAVSELLTLYGHVTGDTELPSKLDLCPGNQVKEDCAKDEELIPTGHCFCCRKCIKIGEEGDVCKLEDGTRVAICQPILKYRCKLNVPEEGEAPDGKSYCEKTNVGAKLKALSAFKPNKPAPEAAAAPAP